MTRETREVSRAQYRWLRRQADLLEWLKIGVLSLLGAVLLIMTMWAVL